ncbi:hypothetical protein OF83DRAFT_1086852 [Amylostereum chailletii]|nr:hypothetical protein OF83DRAFT_1086852 [Amylostereum chailletii]
MSTISTGTYVITNVSCGDIVALQDGNTDTPITVETDKQENKGKWTVNLLSNGKYTLKNFEYATFAHVESRAREGTEVNAQTAAKQWVIKETNNKGKYTINPSDAPDLYWYIPGDETGTPIELKNAPTSKRAWFTFHK